MLDAARQRVENGAQHAVWAYLTGVDEESRMPPVLSAKQMFQAGVVLLVVGFLVAVGVNGAFFAWWTSISSVTFTATALFGQVLMTVGAVLLASSPIARRLEVRDAERERGAADRVPLP